MSNIQRYQPTQVASSTLAVDHVTGLPRDVFPGQYTDKERGMIMAICERYGFDPLLKEVELLHGQIFVTAKGINRISTSDPTFNGVEVEIVHQDWTKGKEFFVVKARVWKKGCDHPIEDIADSDGSKMKGGNLFRHTITRAKARAMRTAFSIPFCSKEELTDDDQQGMTALEPASEPEPVRKQIAEPEDRNRAMKRIHAGGRDLGLTHDEIRTITGAVSLLELSAEQLDAWADAIRDLSEADVAAMNAMKRAATPEELQAAWKALSKHGKTTLVNAKDAAKVRIGRYIQAVEPEVASLLKQHSAHLYESMTPSSDRPIDP